MAIVLILGSIGGCGYVAYKGISALHPTAAALRPDFPAYPGARQQTSFAVRPNSGVGTVTTVQWITKDKPSPAIAYYRAQAVITTDAAVSPSSERYGAGSENQRPSS